MENETMESENVVVAQMPKNNLFKVTPLSKYLAMALFVVLPFLGAWVGYTFAPVEQVEVEKVVYKQVPIPIDLLEKPIEGYKDSGEGAVSMVDVPKEYASSSFRTVAVVSNPYYAGESKYDSLIIASQRGDNDYSCGGMYTSSNCYIFLESNYYGVKTPEYVGEWNGHPESMRPDTIKFISPTVIEFKTGFGDAGVSSASVWQIDLTTGSSTRSSHEKSYSD